MYVFLLTFFPVALFLFCATNTNYTWKKFLFHIIFGLVAGLFVCFFQLFFIFSDFFPTKNGVLYFVHFYAKDVLLPCGILALVSVIFTRESAEYKAESLFPLCASFYISFVPYNVITFSESTSFFPIFVKPVLIASACFFISVLARLMVKYAREKKQGLVVSLVLAELIAGAVPALLQTYWFYTGEKILPAVLAAAFLSGSVFIYAFLQKRTERTPIFMQM